MSVLLSIPPLLCYRHDSTSTAHSTGGLCVPPYPILTTRFAHLVDHTADCSSSSASDAASAVTIDSLRALIAGMLGLSGDQLDVSEPLTRQGLDSLLAVELSATLKKRCGGLNVSQMELLGGMSVEAILEASEKGK